MGVWDLRGLHDQIKKFEKLAKSKGISDSDREHFLRCAQKAREDYDRYAAQWEEIFGSERKVSRWERWPISSVPCVVRQISSRSM